MYLQPSLRKDCGSTVPIHDSSTFQSPNPRLLCRKRFPHFQHQPSCPRPSRAISELDNTDTSTRQAKRNFAREKTTWKCLCRLSRCRPLCRELHRTNFCSTMRLAERLVSPLLPSAQSSKSHPALIFTKFGTDVAARCCRSECRVWLIWGAGQGLRQTFWLPLRQPSPKSICPLCQS